MNDKRSLKIFIAVAIGILVGGLVANDIAGRLDLLKHLWGIGALVGGLVAYLSYDPLVVVRAIPRAWALACSGVSRAHQNQLACQRRVWRRRRQLVVIWLSYVSISASIIIGLFVFIAIITLIAPSSNTTLAEFMEYFTWAWLFLLVALTNPFSIAEINYEDGTKFEKEYAESCKILRTFNPFNIYGRIVPLLLIKTCFYFLPIILFWRLPKLLLSFGWHLIKLIHSDWRLLCGIDAAIFVALGFIYWPSLPLMVNAVIGGIFGVLNYEILSKRVWHLVPQKE